MPVRPVLRIPRRAVVLLAASALLGGCATSYQMKVDTSSAPPEARIEDGVTLTGPCFIDAGAHIKSGATIGAYTVIGRGVLVEEGANLHDTIIWPNSRIGQNAVVHGPIIGRSCHVGRDSVLKGQSLLGDKSQLTDFTSIGHD